MQYFAKRDAGIYVFPKFRCCRASISQVTVASPSNYLLNTSFFEFGWRFLQNVF
jgi:hypothetical protein